MSDDSAPTFFAGISALAAIVTGALSLLALFLSVIGIFIANNANHIATQANAIATEGNAILRASEERKRPSLKLIRSLQTSERTYATIQNEGTSQCALLEVRFVPYGERPRGRFEPPHQEFVPVENQSHVIRVDLQSNDPHVFVQAAVVRPGEVVTIEASFPPNALQGEIVLSHGDGETLSIASRSRFGFAPTKKIGTISEVGSSD